MQKTKVVKAAGRIKIVKIPAGEAPAKIRGAWVGLILPCDPYLGWPTSDGPDRGVLSGKEAARNRCSFSVPQDEAIRILEESAPEAAAWWREKGFPHSGECFGFAEDEAEILSGVTRQKIIHVDEEMRGDPNR